MEYLLDFPFAGTFNYTSTTIDKDLASATVSFWMRTDDVINQGTPFSYASSPEMDNAFTLTSYDGYGINFNGFSVYDVIGNQQAASHTLTDRKQLVELFLQLCIILNGDMKM